MSVNKWISIYHGLLQDAELFRFIIKEDAKFLCLLHSEMLKAVSNVDGIR